MNRKQRRQATFKRAALSAPATTTPEPFAYTTGTYGGHFTLEPMNPAITIPKGFALYLHPPATAPEHLEWPEFEPWAQYVGMNVSKDANGYYTSEATDMAWQAWEMAKNQKMTVGPPATAPTQPSWHDAPTVPGLWWVAGTAGIFHIDEAALPIYKGSAHRWFGPIPPDSGDKS